MATATAMREERPTERLVIRAAGKIVLFNPEEIDWIEASANYVRIHAGAREYVVRDTMANIEKRLGARFLRIHRSIIVNVERVRTLAPSNNAESALILSDGKELPVGRSRRAQVDALLRSLLNPGGVSGWPGPAQS